MEPCEIAPGVWVFTSRVMRTTTTVVAGASTAAGRGVVLVDPAWEPDELEAIAGWLEAKSLVVVAGWATHAHHDHVLWHPRFGEVTRYATAAAARDAGGERDSLVAGLGPDWPAGLAPLVGGVVPLEGDTLPWAGPAIRVVAHDAHAHGHGALWLEEAAVLVAGDMLSDVEIPLPDDEGPVGYLRGLRVLEPFARRARVLVPGHGNVARATADGGDTPSARVDRDLAYLDGLARGADDPRLHGAPHWLLDQHERNAASARAAGPTGRASS